MATEKILIFDEAGNAKRMKVRIARFLDNEPVTASDKTNIRTTLDVDDSLSGTFTTPLSVTSASDSSFTGGGKVGIGTPSPSGSGWDESATVLHVKKDDTSGGLLALESSNTKAILNAGNNQLAVFTTTADPIRLGTSGSEAVRIDSSGNVGIGTSSPGSLSAAANNLVVGSGTGNQGLTVFSGSANEAAIYFADGTAGNQAYRSYIVCQHASDNLVFGTAGATRWTINSTGNLVAGSGLGIDFGSTNTNTGVTVTGSVMSEYEAGTWTPSFETSGSGFTNPPTMNVTTARYVRIGNLVTFYAFISTDSVDLTGAGTFLVVTGLPYAATVSSGTNNAAASIGYAANFNNAPFGGYVVSGSSYLYLTKRTTSTGNVTVMSPSDLTAGAVASRNELALSGSYYTNA